MTGTTSNNSWLDSLLNAGGTLFGKSLDADAAADRAKLDLKKTQAQAAGQTATSKALIIGGALLAIAVVAILIFRRK